MATRMFTPAKGTRQRRRQDRDLSGTLPRELTGILYRESSTVLYREHNAGSSADEPAPVLEMTVPAVCWIVLQCRIPYCNLVLHVVLHHTVLEHAVLYCTVLCRSVLRSAVYCTVLHSNVLHSTVPFCTALCGVVYCTVLHGNVLQRTAPHCTALCCTALCCTVLSCTGAHPCAGAPSPWPCSRPPWRTRGRSKRIGGRASRPARGSADTAPAWGPG